MSRKVATAIATAALAALCGSAAEAASLTELMATRRPHPAELAAESRLREAGRRLAASAGIVRDGATLAAAAGPRRSDGESSGDVGLEIDLPLWTAQAARRAALGALTEAAPALRAAARAEAELDLALAALELWRAEREVELAERSLKAVERWSEEAVERVEAGAAADYERWLVAGEVARARLDLSAAAAARAAARERLEARLERPIEGLAIELPADASLAVEDLESRFAAGAPLAAAQASAALVAALAELEVAAEGSRWGVTGALEREGEEEVARFGLSYRIAPRGEATALEARREASSAAARREGEIAAGELAARLAAARTRLATSLPEVSDEELDRAARALDLRLVEGSARLAELLPIHRAIVESRRTLVAARAARLEALFEIDFLTREVTP